MKPLMHVRHLSFHYQYSQSKLSEYSTSKKINRQTNEKVLSDVSLDIHEGESIGVLGKNGAGKTTLLRILSGALSPQKGKIDFFGTRLLLLELESLNAWRLSVSQVLHDYCVIVKIPKRNRNEFVKQILMVTELEHKSESIWETLSAGQKMRLSIVLQVQLGLDLVLIDESIGFADYSFEKKLDYLVQKGMQSSKSIVIASHNFALIERLCNRVLIIRQNNVFFDGTPSEGIALYKNLEGSE